MILSEKITELRKRYGFSQEQLGERIGVSRQAVSKWEMAQSVPDISKIIALSDLFGVPADLLLKDDMELDAPFADMGKGHTSAARAEDGVRLISIEEINEYLSARETASKKIALVILLFCTSPFAGILLSAANDQRLGIIGGILEVIILAAAGALLALTVYNMKQYAYIRDPAAELAYGVRGAVGERKNAFGQTRILGIVIGIALLFCSVIPMMICSIFASAGDLAIAACGCVMLLMIAAGICCIVYVCYIYRGFTVVLRHR